MHTMRALFLMGATLMIAGTAWAGFTKVYTYPPEGWCLDGNLIDARSDELSDFNGDGKPDIFPDNGSQLSIITLSGQDFTPLTLWSYTLPGVPDGVSMVAAQLTPDQGKEVVVDWYTYTGVYHVLVITSTGDLIWDFDGYYMLDLADFNGDGFEDLVLKPAGGGSYGMWAYDPGTSGVPTALPNAGRLDQNVPNPFNPSTTITFELPSRGPAELVIFDLRGRLIQQRDLGELEPGPHAVTWDGKDADGRTVAAGAYHYLLRTRNWESARTMVHVK